MSWLATGEQEMVHHHVAVVGSYNVGLFLKGQKLPLRGETVTGDQFYEGGGGKGSNQAIAASRLGADTKFIGRIGADRYGTDALALYQRSGIGTEYITIDDTTHSGISVILIDREGNNLISVVPGANSNLCAADIDKAQSVLTQAAIVGFQLENRLAVVDYAIRKVHTLGVKTLLDPAPAVPLPESLYACIDYLKPNETEASVLTGIPVIDPESAARAGRWMLDRGTRCVIVTLGRQGAVLVTGGQTRLLAPPPVTAIDTTGAGDVFSGGFMAALSQGKSIEEAVVFANYAAALSVTRLGVIDAIPQLEEVIALMKSASRG